MGPEIRVNDNKGFQICATTWNNHCNGCAFGHKTVTNTVAEGATQTYTTTYEILIPYYHCGNLTNKNEIRLAFGGVYESGFVHLFKEGDWEVTHKVTENGMVAA